MPMQERIQMSKSETNLFPLLKYVMYGKQFMLTCVQPFLSASKALRVFLRTCVCVYVYMLTKLGTIFQEMEGSKEHLNNTRFYRLQGRP